MYQINLMIKKPIHKAQVLKLVMKAFSNRYQTLQKNAKLFILRVVQVVVNQPIQKKIIKQHLKNNPDIEIYLFSALPDDESLDSVEPKRIILDDTIISDPVDVKEFGGCIVNF